MDNYQELSQITLELRKFKPTEEQQASQSRFDEYEKDLRAKLEDPKKGGAIDATKNCR